MTLIEILLVFIFAFLLVLNIYYSKNNELTTDVDEVRQIVANISKHFPSAETDSQDESGPGMARVLEDLKKVEEAIDDLAKANAFEEPELWRIVTNKGGLANVMDALEEFEDRQRKLENDNAAMEEALAAAGIAKPTHVSGGRGDRPGNCWYSDPIRKRGDQYLLHVTIFENHLAVKPDWPEERADDVDLLPIDEIRGRIPGDMTGNELMQLTRAIFEESKKNNCRYFVRIFEQAETKKGFQDRLREIESRFYKLSENF